MKNDEDAESFELGRIEYDNDSGRVVAFYESRFEGHEPNFEIRVTKPGRNPFSVRLPLRKVASLARAVSEFRSRDAERRENMPQKPGVPRGATEPKAAMPRSGVGRIGD